MYSEFFWTYCILRMSSPVWLSLTMSQSPGSTGVTTISSARPTSSSLNHFIMDDYRYVYVVPLFFIQRKSKVIHSYVLFLLNTENFMFSMGEVEVYDILFRLLMKFRDISSTAVHVPVPYYLGRCKVTVWPAARPRLGPTSTTWDLLSGIDPPDKNNNLFIGNKGKRLFIVSKPANCSQAVSLQHLEIQFLFTTLALDFFANEISLRSSLFIIDKSIILHKNTEKDQIIENFCVNRSQPKTRLRLLSGEMTEMNNYSSTIHILRAFRNQKRYRNIWTTKTKYLGKHCFPSTIYQRPEATT
jgi:hypothetical protein